MKKSLLILCALLTQTFAAPAPEILKVSENKHFLVTGDNQPFFWLGDTAWEMFHRLDRDDANLYLTERANQGFTVIQAVILAEMDGLNTPNAYGYKPFIDNDPTKPDIRDGVADDYWDHVDYLINRANALGLVVGLLPTWGDKWNQKGGAGPEIFNPENARIYGEWLGKRYVDKSIVWITGGDRPIDNDKQLETIRAMAEGLRKGDGGKHLITFHPGGGRSSSEKLHNEPWLDFNMRQNGHTLEFNDRYLKTNADYHLTPTKPVIDGEPLYEDHPASFAGDQFGYSTAVDVRHAIYWDLFEGAFGHTYGNHSVWQMSSSQFEPKNKPLQTWDKALKQLGATQMKHAKNLLLSRPFLTRIPDDSLIVTSKAPGSVPGAGTRRFVATRDEEGSYAMIYVPVGRKFSVDLSKIKNGPVECWWFNPRSGLADHFAQLANTGTALFTPPELGELIDWVLVLDDGTRKYPAPGTVTPAR